MGSVSQHGSARAETAPKSETVKAHFSVLGIQMPGYHDFGTALMDPSVARLEGIGTIALLGNNISRVLWADHLRVCMKGSGPSMQYVIRNEGQPGFPWGNASGLSTTRWAIPADYRRT